MALAFTDVIYLQGSAEVLALAPKGLKKFPISYFPLNRLVNRDWLFFNRLAMAHTQGGWGGGESRKREPQL